MRESADQVINQIVTRMMMVTLMQSKRDIIIDSRERGRLIDTTWTRSTMN